MANRLALIALTGLSVSAICLGAAAAIGINQFGEGFDLPVFADGARCQSVTGATATSRDLEWDGSDHVSVDVPAHTQYSPTNGPKLHVSGDPQMLAHLRVRNGNIGLDCRGHFFDSDLTITLPGRQFRKFAIAGSGDMQLDRIDQPDLRIGIAGSGSVTASGKTQDSSVSIAGSGKVDLGQVIMQNALVKINGSGSADITPSGKADIHINGSGTVNLHGAPKDLETHVAGSGTIRSVGTGGI